MRYTSAQQAFAITSRNVTPSRAGPGLLLCRSGTTTETVCGRVERTFVSITVGGRSFTRPLETRICSQAGDSGGPVYTRSNQRDDAGNWHPQGRAFAIHKGSTTGPCRSYHSHIRYVEDALDVRVWTN